MAGNSFGKLFRLTTYGESHGIAIGGIIDGCPAGLKVNLDLIQNELSKRKPGQSDITSPRNEDDIVTLQSGIFEGVTTGTPIGFVIQNKDQRPKDYAKIKDSFRPSHADYTYFEKYGIRDYRGGGRSSARETACRVVAGVIAKQLLATYGIQINAFVTQIGTVVLDKTYETLNLGDTFSNPVRCPDSEVAHKMIQEIETIRAQGDSLGGKVTCIISRVPAGLGEPVFDRLEADLAKAMLSINATKGFEIGSGFEGATKKGSEHNDTFFVENNTVKTTTNNSGGVQGGISNGQDIYFNVAFKPTATIL